MATNDYTKIEGTITRETPAALLFTIEDNYNEESSSHWFPKSQIVSITRRAENMDSIDVDTISVANWLLKQKGII